ncbi:hypothetical protein [Sphingopyxis sp. GC21]|uniref:hypothetical protein n=1 Tax=Sphingopyxis sp. GC21 TaxID=2933562 RepID=UPI0021E3CC64|nr:hypothetical protein [Sphingopyxis sp. GC21]
MAHVTPFRSGVGLFTRTLSFSVLPLVVAYAFAAESGTGPVDRMIATELSFAADAQRIGIAPAFRRYAATDGILMRPDPAPALEVLQGNVDTPGVRLEWKPAIAGMSLSGDLGFTTGPYRLFQGAEVMNGDTLTVWVRGADGRWGWLLDHGLLPIKASAPAGLPGEVAIMRQGQPGPRRRPSGVIDADAALNAEVIAQGTAVIPGRLADDGFVLRLQRGRVPKAAAVDAVGDNLRVSTAQRFGMRVSRAEDLATTYGRLTFDGAQPSRNYVRIWRHDASGWQLLVDLIN